MHGQIQIKSICFSILLLSVYVNVVDSMVLLLVIFLTTNKFEKCFFSANAWSIIMIISVQLLPRACINIFILEIQPCNYFIQGVQGFEEYILKSPSFFIINPRLRVVRMSKKYSDDMLHALILKCNPDICFESPYCKIVKVVPTKKTKMFIKL